MTEISDDTSLPVGDPVRLRTGFPFNLILHLLFRFRTGQWGATLSASQQQTVLLNLTYDGFEPIEIDITGDFSFIRQGTKKTKSMTFRMYLRLSCHSQGPTIVDSPYIVFHKHGDIRSIFLKVIATPSSTGQILVVFGSGASGTFVNIANLIIDAGEPIIFG